MNILFYLVPKRDVIYVSEEDSLVRAMEIMEQYRYTSVPVLNRSGGYVGSLREGDILWALKAQQGSIETLLETLQVRQLKRLHDNEPVNINCDMEELVQTAMNENFIPVIDDRQSFIGIITRRSVISYFISEQNKVRDASPPDSTDHGDASPPGSADHRDGSSVSAAM